LALKNNMPVPIPVRSDSTINWKYLSLIILVLALIICGVLFYCEKWAERRARTSFPSEKTGFSPRNEKESCENFKNLEKRSACYTNLAIKTRNENYCKRIETPFKARCYFELAVATENITYCKKIKSITPALKDRCYVELAFLKNDISICDKVELPFWKSSCIKRLEEKKAKIAHWNTFRNEEYKYEIKFPSNYVVEVESVDFVRIFYPYLIRVPNVGFPRGVSIKIKVYNNPKRLPLVQWLASSMEIWDIKPISVAGIEGIIGVHNCDSECMGPRNWVAGSDCVKGIFIPKEDKIYNIDLEGEIGWNFDEENPENICYFGEESIFAKILSTFRFIN